MPQAFEETPLWRRTLGATEPPGVIARQAMRAAYDQLRTVVEQLAGEISRSTPTFTDHSIEHADALWDTASLISGPEYPINCAEAFILGGAFLLHDLGMALASFPEGVAALERDRRFGDLLAASAARLRRADPAADPSVIERAARDEVVVELLRFRHAEQAERLVTQIFHTADGQPFYLLENVQLRQNFGSLIGRVAHSHSWDVSDLVALDERRGSCVDHPPEWEVDPLKLACLLRLADVAHIDQRRAPAYLHAFRRPTGVSGDHWYFQSRLTRPRIDGDRLAQETIRAVDDELRRVDALCADLGRPRFPVRSVAGADSPQRLARHIHTHGWEPIDAKLRVSDATGLIANLGGEDLYGRKPEVALRELIANAADATRARQVHEGAPGAAVTVTLSEEDGDWWLTVADQGIGMSRDTMVSSLTDFGYSRWRTPDLLEDFPGLFAKGFHATGQFGIGFFAVFMVADEVQVRSLAYGEALATTHILEFGSGVTGRPTLRQAEPEERLRAWGTVVRLKLRLDPVSQDGLFKTTRRDLTHTRLLHGRLMRLCALSDIDIAAQGPEDPAPVKLISGGDWTTIPADELFRRLYRREEESQLDRLIIDGYEKLFIERAQSLYDEHGAIVGRAMMATGWECVYPDMYWLRPPEGHVYVGGLHASELDYCMGAFVGEPLTADRLRAFPLFSRPELYRWLNTQADAVKISTASNEWDRWLMGLLIRGFGADAPQSPCGTTVDRALDRAGLVGWLAGKDEILLVAETSLNTLQTPQGRPLFLSFEGRSVEPPSNVLFIPLNPFWLYPEEVRPRPRDERFADAVYSDAEWDVRTWWYDTGNFGTPGLVIRTIAEEWDIDVVEAVNSMEPLHVRGDQDLRLVLPTSDGHAVRATAIRMRRPRRGLGGTVPGSAG
jgi:signal transduction histidine kinase